MAVVFETIGKIVKGLFFEKQDKPLEQVLLEDIRTPKQNPSQRKLLDLIGQKESNGNYNAYFGNAGNKDIDFTGMTVADVRRWQDDFVRKGSKSSAVGKYQIIRKTMDSLLKEMNLTGKEKFTPELQDQMALTLAKRRGYDKFIKGKMPKEKFANELAKEWASFPVIGGDKHGRSYYAGDGLNKALIGPNEVLAALDEELKLTRV